MYTKIYKATVLTSRGFTLVKNYMAKDIEEAKASVDFYMKEDGDTIIGDVKYSHSIEVDGVAIDEDMTLDDVDHLL